MKGEGATGATSSPFSFLPPVPFSTSHKNFSQAPFVSSTSNYHFSTGDKSGLNSVQNLKVSNKIPICTSTGTQTDDVIVSNNFIASLNGHDTPLPLIEIRVANHELFVLLDTGSTLSILSHSFFLANKAQLNYKNLSRSVTISTLNSQVHFHGCIELSFKIKNKFFKHPFYLVDLSPLSRFLGILGFEFFKKHNLHFDEKLTCLQGLDLKVPLLNNESVNIVVSQILDNSKAQCDATSVHQDQSEQQHKVVLSAKVLIPPKSKAYVKAQFTTPCNNKSWLFETDSHSSFFHASLFDVDSLGEQNMDSFKDSVHTHNFMLCCYNNTDRDVHLNKHTCVGSVSVAEQVEEISDDTLHHFINLIQPTEDILSLRKQEFNLNDFSLEHLEPVQKTQLTNLLQENFSVFSKSLSSLGHTDKVVPRITFTSEFPIKTLPFPIPHALQKEARLQLDQLEAAGIIEKNISEWAAPMLLVKKKPDSSGQQKFRLALDLRLINSIILHSSYPLPKIHDIISQISKFKFFSTLDMAQAYHQVDLPEQYQDKLSFVTPWGTYRYKRMVFGLKTAASTFQALIDTIIDETGLSGIFPYQDDILICSNSFDETMTKLSILFDAFQKNNLTLSAPKCSFHSSEVNYLGFMISNNRICPIQSNIMKINSFPVPTTKKQLKRFVGLCGYYRHLIPCYADLIQPLQKLTNQRAVFHFSEEHKMCFQRLQKIFFSKPFLRQPDFSKEFLLNTDASKVAISAVLMQEFEGELYPVSYFSRTLSRTEVNYPALKLELLAIVKGILAFKHFLYGRHFIILSDSKPLSSYKKSTSPADLTTRWLLLLSEYSFTFQHISGQKNLLADFLSRVSIGDAHNSNLANTPYNVLTREGILPVVEWSPLRLPAECPPATATPPCTSQSVQLLTYGDSSASSATPNEAIQTVSSSCHPSAATTDQCYFKTGQPQACVESFYNASPNEIVQTIPEPSLQTVVSSYYDTSSRRAIPQLAPTETASTVCDNQVTPSGELHLPTTVGPGQRHQPPHPYENSNIHSPSGDKRVSPSLSATTTPQKLKASSAHSDESGTGQVAARTSLTDDAGVLIGNGVSSSVISSSGVCPVIRQTSHDCAVHFERVKSTNHLCKSVSTALHPESCDACDYESSCHPNNERSSSTELGPDPPADYDVPRESSLSFDTELNSSNFVNHNSSLFECVLSLNVLTSNMDVDPLLEISHQTLLKDQLKDRKLSLIYNKILNRQKIEHFCIDPATRLLMFCKTEDDCLTLNNSSKFKIVVPDSLKAKALTIAHATHFGSAKTYEFLCNHFYWSGMYTDCLNFVSSCELCITTKPQRVPHAPLQPTILPKTPGEFVSIDLVGPFHNNKHILTVIDHHSKHLELYPVNAINSDAIANAMLQYISVHGRPTLILSDLGTQLTSDAFESLNRAIGIKLIHSSSGHPQANAVSERINSSIKSTIKTLIAQGISFQNAVLLHKALYNGSVHRTTKFTPNLIHFGRSLALPLDVYSSNFCPAVLNQNPKTHLLLQDLQMMYKIVYGNLTQHQLTQNIDANVKAKIRSFNINDIVYLKSKDKFRPSYKGPFCVLKIHSPVTCVIQRAENPAAPSFLIHFDRLRKAPRRFSHLKDTYVCNSGSNQHPYNLRPRNSGI